MSVDLIKLVIFSIWILSTLLTCIFGLNFYTLIWLSRRKPHSKPSLPEDLPRVSIHIPVYNEAAVIEDTLKACLNLDYPRGLLEVFLIDDSTDKTTEILERYVKRLPDFFKLIRRGSREGFKAGALEKALHESSTEFIAVLDADTVPERDFLKKAIAHFYGGGKIAFVQGRLAYRNYSESWLTKACSLIYEWYRVFTQKALSRGRLFVASVGSAVVYRREALIDVGGWMWDTLSEDLDMSVRLQMKGWKSVFADDAVCMDEVPRTLNIFRKQYSRHIKGPLENFRKHAASIISCRDLGLICKVEELLILSSPSSFMLGLLSLVTGIIFYLLSIPTEIQTFWLSTVGLSLSLIFLLSFVAPLIGYAYILKGGRIGEIKHLAAIGLIISDNLLMGTKSILELIFKRGNSWERTRKFGVGQKYMEGLNVRSSLEDLGEIALRVAASILTFISVFILSLRGLLPYSLGFLLPPLCWLIASTID